MRVIVRSIELDFDFKLMLAAAVYRRIGCLIYICFKLIHIISNKCTIIPFFDLLDLSVLFLIYLDARPVYDKF